MGRLKGSFRIRGAEHPTHLRVLPGGRSRHHGAARGLIRVINMAAGIALLVGLTVGLLLFLLGVMVDVLVMR